MRKLSLSNGGFARNIYVASDATLQLNNFYKQVASPLLSNVTFDYIPGQVRIELPQFFPKWFTQIIKVIQFLGHEWYSNEIGIQ